MESTGRFEKIFLKMLRETNISGADGAFGDGASMHTIFGPNAAAQNIDSGDTYAPGDAKIYTPIGKVQTRKGSVGGKKRRRKNKKTKGVNFATGEENEEVPEEEVEEKSE